MPPKGHKHTAAAKAKMSAGRSVPQIECICDTCGAVVFRDRSEIKRRKNVFCNKECEMIFRKGVPRPRVVCDKISKSQKGKTLSEEHIKNIKVGATKRWEDPEERKRMSERATGRIIPEGVRTKMGMSRRRVLTEDPDVKIRALEGMLGGFWYGNVKYWYSESPQYCEKFNAEFKERVRAFWSYTCFQCGTPQNGKKLGVHHIHYDKKMCCNGSPQDCIPLCGSCHPKTNYNRDYWEDYFTELLYAYSPDGKCFFTKEEMKKVTSSTF